MDFDHEKIADAILDLIEEPIVKLLRRVEAVEKQLASLPLPQDGKDGKDADMNEVRSIISDELKTITDAVNSIRPAPELPDIPKMIDEAIGARIDVEDMERSIEQVVRAVVAEIPLPKDGKDGLPGERGEKGECGVGVAGAFIERDGSLAVTLSNGEVKNLGPVCGKDGAPGQDGKDGIGFDDLDLVEDASGLSLKFIKGDAVKSFPLPVVIDRGVFRDGQTYQKGSGVTWGGRYWIAQETTSDKPDGGKSWRLAVNKGRDGKDVKKAGE